MIALLVIVGHLLGDWVVQTDAQAAVKTTSWRANLTHVSTYHLTMILFVVWGWHDWRALLALAVSFASHAFIDRRWPVRWLMAHTGSRPFSEQMWGVLVVDQVLHLSILLTLVALLAPGFRP